MSSDNEYFSENDEVQPETVNLDNSPREIPNTEDETREHKDEENESKKKVVKPKRTIAIPKFNEQTIRNAKGLPAVLNHFNDVTFKSPGFEEQDLNRLLKIYEYWCHRFYPKFTFDDCIHRLEWLGNKKSTQVYLRKIRMGIEEVFEENVREENDHTEGFVEPFDDQFDNLLSTHNSTSKPELTDEQLEQINKNRLRAETIRRERMSKINGETSQATSSSTVCKNIINESHDLELQADEEELDLDNILKMVNEDVDSSSSEAVLDINKETLYDKKISNAIRRNAVSNNEIDLNNTEVTRISTKHSYGNEGESESDCSINSDKSTVSSNDSTVLYSSQLRKKKSKSIQKVNDSRSSFRKKRKILTDSDDSDSSSLPHFSNKRKSTLDIDNILRDSNLQQKSTLTETEHIDKDSQIKIMIESDKDNINEIPDESSGSINSLIKKNYNNTIEENSIKHVIQETNNFLESDLESDGYDDLANQHIHKFKQKGRLIIDTDDSD